MDLLRSAHRNVIEREDAMIDIDDMPLEQRLRTVIARLELCSETSAQAYDTKNGGKSAEEPGGKRPGGGRDWKGDRDQLNVLKSADHFRKRLAGAHSQRTLQLILHDAEDSLAAHKRRPAPLKTDDPPFGTPFWRRYVAESDESASVLAGRLGGSRQYIEKVRKQWAVRQAA